VIFRLGRVKRGGSQGPGLFFIIPCIDSIQATAWQNFFFFFFYYGDARMINRAPCYKRKKNCEQYFKGFVPLKDIFFIQHKKTTKR
jgi:hypothetical protein